MQGQINIFSTVQIAWWFTLCHRIIKNKFQRQLKQEGTSVDAHAIRYSHSTPTINANATLSVKT